MSICLSLHSCHCCYHPDLPKRNSILEQHCWVSSSALDSKEGLQELKLPFEREEWFLGSRLLKAWWLQVQSWDSNLPDEASLRSIHYGVKLPIYADSFNINPVLNPGLISIRIPTGEQHAAYASNRGLANPRPTHLKHPTLIFRISNRTRKLQFWAVRREPNPILSSEALVKSCASTFATSAYAYKKPHADKKASHIDVPNNWQWKLRAN